MKAFLYWILASCVAILFILPFKISIKNQANDECIKYIKYGDVACMDYLGLADSKCLLTNWNKMQEVCKF